MNIDRNRFYSGQAIAIVMVVLVVATILGASLYSRTLKNKEAAINTRDSQMALEQADTLLDMFVRRDTKFLQDMADTGIPELPLTYERIGTVTDKTTLAGFLADNDLDTTLINKVDNWCEDPATGSSLKVTIDYADNNDMVDVRVGSARVFNTFGAAIVDCNLDIFVESREMETSLFAVKKIYANADGEIGEYVNEGSTDDIVAYCLGNCEEDDITNIAVPAASFEIYADEISVNLNDSRDGYSLYQVRVIPLYGNIAVGHSVDDTCSSKKFQFLKVNAAVNCYGSYREKQVMIPGSDSVGYSTLFDYTIYNKGILKPN